MLKNRLLWLGSAEVAIRRKTYLLPSQIEVINCLRDAIFLSNT
jgi:hypothetical protein